MKSRSYSTAIAIIMVQVVSVVICNAATIATGKARSFEKLNDCHCILFGPGVFLVFTNDCPSA